MLNKVIIMGRLTRDPEVRNVGNNGNNVSVCSFSIACDRDIVNKQTNERETDFFDITAWRSTADFIGKYFSKGRMIVVVGRLQKRNYTDKEGNKRTATDIIADTVYFGDSKKDAESSGGGAPAADTPTNTNQQSGDSAETADDDELPF